MRCAKRISLLSVFGMVCCLQSACHRGSFTLTSPPPPPNCTVRFVPAFAEPGERDITLTPEESAVLRQIVNPFFEPHTRKLDRTTFFGGVPYGSFLVGSY